MWHVALKTSYFETHLLVLSLTQLNLICFGMALQYIMVDISSLRKCTVDVFTNLVCMSFQFDRAQGEPSLGAGLDVAQEHEDGGERTDWQVRGKICIKLIKNTKIQEQ